MNADNSMDIKINSDLYYAVVVYYVCMVDVIFPAAACDVVTSTLTLRSTKQASNTWWALFPLMTTCCRAPLLGTCSACTIGRVCV